MITKFGSTTDRKVDFKQKVASMKTKTTVDFADLMGVFHSTKKFSKEAARKAYIKDLIAGKI